MTPEELAKNVNDAINEVVSDETKQTLAGYSAGELQRFIHALHFLTRERHFEVAKIALQVRISSDQAESAAKLERYTFWLIALTVALVVITFFDLAERFCHIHN